MGKSASTLTEPRVRAVLALELSPGASPPAHDALPQAGAGELAGLVAADLAGFAADAAGLQLGLVGAHYDPVELLRPGWPLHGELERLVARAPGHGPRVVAFGAHDGQLPGPLAPAPEFSGGPLRLLPLVLTGDAQLAEAVGQAFEQDLVEHGMAGAATALKAQEAFGMTVEHARYMTLHDLCAMTALQYEHAGLAPLWPVLETALLSPGRSLWLDEPPEPLLHFTGAEARIALFEPEGWMARYGGDERDPDRLSRRYALFQARQRQYAALLQAHGIPVTFVHCRNREDPRRELD